MRRLRFAFFGSALLALAMMLWSPAAITLAGSKPPPKVAPAAPAAPGAPAPNTVRNITFGLAGQGATWENLDPPLLQSEAAAGITYRLLELDWKDFQPAGPNDWDGGVQANVQARIDAILAAAPDTQFYLDLGLQYPPAWAAALDPLVDQAGHVWQASPNNGGGVNIYWSPAVRAAVAVYLQRVFATLNFHDHLWTVRIGSYVGELLYPDQVNPGSANSFWAFDSTAQATSPVPGWRPGQPSPNGEAGRFYNWYVDNLAGTFNFLLGEIRHYFAGYVAPVTAGGGMAPPALANLLAGNLYDPNQVHYGTGNDWVRIFSELGPDANILHWCSSVGDVSGTDENSANWWDWSSAKQEAWLAQQNGRPIFAENPGHNAYDSSQGADPRTTMQWIFNAVHSYGFVGLMWIREDDMRNPDYASLDQYSGEIGLQSGCPGTFGDAGPTSPYFSVINDLVARQAISGYADCTFRPNATITRGQAAKVLIAALNVPLSIPRVATFRDVPPGSPFYAYVETAAAHHMIDGYADRTFRYNAPINRADLAKMVVVARGWPLAAPRTPSFRDVSAAQPFFSYVETAAQHGVISGYTCGGSCREFRPDATATRGQGTKVIDLALTLP